MNKSFLKIIYFLQTFRLNLQFMLLLIVFSTITFANHGASGIANADDGAISITGGGNGIACFEPGIIGTNALDIHGVLKPEYREKIKHLYLVDYWELDRLDDYFKPKDGEDPKNFLLRILNEHWLEIDQELINKLVYFIKLVEVPSKPNLDEKIKGLVRVIHDYKKIAKPIPINCVVVGIFNRYIKSNNQNYPKFSIQGDFDLYEKLLTLNDPQVGILNQALLILHEAIYIIGSELGMSTSYSVRSLSRVFLLKTDLETLKNLDYSPTLSLKILLDELGFDLHTLLFPEEFKTDPKQKSRQESYRTLQLKVKKFVNSYFNLNENSTQEEIEKATEKIRVSHSDLALLADPEKKHGIQMKLLHLREYADRLADNIISQSSPEEVFLFFAMGIMGYDPNQSIIKNFNVLIENAYVPTVEIENICQSIDHFIKRKEGNLYKAKLKHYCINEAHP